MARRFISTQDTHTFRAVGPERIGPDTLLGRPIRGPRHRRVIQKPRVATLPGPGGRAGSPSGVPASRQHEFKISAKRPRTVRP